MINRCICNRTIADSLLYFSETEGKDKAMRNLTVTFLALMCVVALVACSAPKVEQPSPQQTQSNDYRLAGDAELPELSAEYSYVLAKAGAKNPENDSIEIEVLEWNMNEPFNKSSLSPGLIGDMLCHELVLYPAGIQDGSIVVISCLTSDADSFPITAYSVERIDWFEDRVERWMNQTPLV